MFFLGGESHVGGGGVDFRSAAAKTPVSRRIRFFFEGKEGVGDRVAKIRVQGGAGSWVLGGLRKCNATTHPKKEEESANGDIRWISTQEVPVLFVTNGRVI